MNEIMKALAMPFDASEVEWRLQYSNDTTGLAVPYIDSRAIQNRLDEVVGGFNWQNIFTVWHNNAQLCGIAIYCEERNEWITKHDGASNSDIEAVKGGLSDAFKRAAVQWGLGRYLYNMEGVWVDVEKKGKTTVIKRDQRKKLDDVYNRAIAHLLNKPASLPKSEPKPINPPIGAEDNVTPFPDVHLYTIRSAKTTTNSAGVSTVIEMKDPNGKNIRAYLRGENPRIAAGVTLRDVKLVEKKGAYGPYFIVETFEVAA